MSFSCLKLLLALTLFVIITEGQRVDRRRSRKECRNDSHCSSRFSCIKTRGGSKKCARRKASAANEAPSEEDYLFSEEVILIIFHSQDLLSRNVLSNVSAPKAVSSHTAIDRLSDCIAPDRDSRHLGTLSTILQHFTHNESSL